MKSAMKKVELEAKSIKYFFFLKIKFFIRMKLLSQVKNDNFNSIPNSDAKYSAEEGFGICGHLLIILSYLILVVGLPFTLCCCMKV